jgi:hypothetical protein
LVDTASFSKTASYISGIGAAVETASYSDKSGYSDTSQLSNAALELSYPNTSTASYAMIAENFSYNHYVDYGIFLATTQSISASQLDLVNVSHSLGVAKSTDVRVVGTVIVPYTSSIVVNESLTLKIKSRDTGIEETIDSTPIYFDVSRTTNLWDSLMSGSMKIPYVLEGSSSLLGNYMMFVTGSSSKIQIESTRTNRFNIASLSDNLSVSLTEPPLFQVSPDGAVLITFYTGSHEGPFTDYRDGMLATGSLTIDDVSVRNTLANSIRYVWSLKNLTGLDCGQCMFLTELTGMPDTLVTLSCDSSSISNISSLSNTTMSHFQCGNNNLTTLPSLPTSLSFLNCSNNSLTTLSGLPNTMSYLNASNNLITSIPSTFPYGLPELYLDYNQIVTMNSTLPDSLATMSISNNPTLKFWFSSFPTSLSWLDISYTALSSITTISPALLYLNAISCSLLQGTIDTICSQSVVNGLSNGTIYFNGNGPIMISTVNNYILPLQAAGWTVGYDYAI